MFEIWLKHLIYENCIHVAFKNVQDNFTILNAPKFDTVIMFISSQRRWLKFSDVVLICDQSDKTKYVAMHYHECEVRELIGDWNYKDSKGIFPLKLHDIHANVFVEPSDFKHVLENVYDRN